MNTMTTDTLDNGAVVINFDDIDSLGDVVRQSGYVMVEQQANQFSVTIFNCDGDVVSETSLPFNFREC